MGFEGQTARISRLIGLIDYSKTMSAAELALKLHVSRRAIFNDLDFLKGRGFEIAFSAASGSYVSKLSSTIRMVDL